MQCPEKFINLTEPVIHEDYPTTLMVISGCAGILWAQAVIPEGVICTGKQVYFISLFGYHDIVHFWRSGFFALECAYCNSWGNMLWLVAGAEQ